MVQFAFNAAQYDPSTGGVDVWEPGIYDVQITSSEVKQTKDRAGYYLALTLTGIAGAVVGKRLVARMNIQNPNPQAVEIAYRELSAICYAVGVPTFQQTEELHGRPFKVRVEKTERKDKPGTFSNDVTGYFDYAGNEPAMIKAQGGGGAPSAVAAPAAPSAPMVAQPIPQSAPAASPFTAPAAAPAQQPAPAAFAPPAQQTVAAPAPTPEPAPAPQQQPWQTGAPAPAAPAAAGSVPPWQQ